MAEKERSKLFIAMLLLFIGVFSVTSCALQGVTSDNAKNGETDRTYFVDIGFEGGTGKAYIESPVEITEKNGKLTAKLVWSSKNYDYMIVDGVRYDNENTGGPSTFTVAIADTKTPLTVIGDTVAMSTPHEIEYVITWGEGTAPEPGTNTAFEAGTTKEAVDKALREAGLSFTEKYELEFAKCFEIERYGDYTLISIENSGYYLVVPKDKDTPEGLPESLVVLKKPVEKTYLVSTSAMDLINACGALNRITLSGTDEKDWYIEDAKKAMSEGRIAYAGKYRAPDYELILERGCDLAIENTMIYHEPAVKEKLTELGIPVLVETSSYEEHPLGRLEWIKLYGVLFDKEDEAEEYFNHQLSLIKPLLSRNNDTGKTAAFFHVTANGLINVRKRGDYITKMISLSGGKYVPENAGDGENVLSTMNMQMEDFYAGASDADILIYNSTIGGEIKSVDELIKKNPLFKDFKAVREGRVYCTERNLFQQITGMAEFMQDLNDIFNDRDRDYTYLKKLY